MNIDGRGCSAAIGSLTWAMRAQKSLATAAIPTAVIKYDDGGQGVTGCIYGISFSCSQRYNIETVLSKEGIRVKQWNVKG